MVVIDYSSIFNTDKVRLICYKIATNVSANDLWMSLMMVGLILEEGRCGKNQSNVSIISQNKSFRPISVMFCQIGLIWNQLTKYLYVL